MSHAPCSLNFGIWNENWTAGKTSPSGIEKEDEARRLEDEYFLHLTTSHASVFSRFVEIVESKITIDDYGDEVVSHLEKEIGTCIEKLKSREGISRFAPNLETRVRSHLSQLFKGHHAQKKGSSAST